MERITRWFVHNSVASNMVMIFVIIAGALTIPLIKMEVFPAIEVDIINISALYPGASPGDVEEAISALESRIKGMFPEIRRVFIEAQGWGAHRKESYNQSQD